MCTPDNQTPEQLPSIPIDDHLHFPTSREKKETNQTFSRIVAALLFVIMLPALMTLAGFLTDRPVEVGEPSPRTIVASSTVRVLDEEATQEQREIARKSVQPVLDPDNAAIASIIQNTSSIFSSLESARQPLSLDVPEGSAPPSKSWIASRIVEAVPTLSEDGAYRVAAMTDGEFNQTKTAALDIARKAASAQLTKEDLEPYISYSLPTAVAVTGVSVEVSETVIIPILKETIVPTMTINQEATEARREEAAAAVDDVQFSVPRLSPIVRVGEVVSENQSLALQELGLQGTDPIDEFFTSIVIMLAMLFACSYFLRSFRPAIWRSGQKLLLFSILINLMAIFIFVAETIPQAGSLRWLAIPIAAITMLATILGDSRIGILSLAPLIAMAAPHMLSNQMFVPYLIIMAILPIPMVGRLSARGDLRKATMRIFIASILTSLIFTLVFVGTEHWQTAVLMGAISGFLTVVLVLGLLPFFESIFDVITTTILLDYADRNHPLLRELETKALGTYNHSVMVATLASRAARAIKADALLCEVMGLYHDIGKVVRPYFFVENQTHGGTNPHDELNDPEQSAIIIKRHVEDGVEMAVLHKLPSAIVDGIRTHHGTTLVAYFYRVACNEAIKNGTEMPSEHQFRYHGAKPFTKEHAVLMLADCCEGATRAASQSGGGLTRETIQKIVSGMINDRVSDGQLDDSPLTFSDLRMVEQVLIQSLEGVYHPRIAYPEALSSNKTSS